MLTTFYDYLDSPIGSLLLAGDGDNLTELGFPVGKGARRHQAEWVHDPGRFREIGRQLTAYFAGELRQFDVGLAPQGTEFQRQVWNALCAIPYGETISYGELARRLGKPTASRAVGAANGRNPIPIIVPCHRVIGSSGKLVGFGGGLSAKQMLLDLEHQRVAPALF